MLLNKIGTYCIGCIVAMTKQRSSQASSSSRVKFASHLSGESEKEKFLCLTLNSYIISPLMQCIQNTSSVWVEYKNEQFDNN